MFKNLFSACHYSMEIISDLLGETNLIYWSTDKTAWKIESVGRQNEIFSSQFLGLAFEKEKKHFSQ